VNGWLTFAPLPPFPREKAWTEGVAPPFPRDLRRLDLRDSQWFDDIQVGPRFASHENHVLETTAYAAHILALHQLHTPRSFASFHVAGTTSRC